MRAMKLLIPLSGALLAAFGVISAPASASAAAPLKCHAWMTNARPADYTTIGVRVQTASHAKVTTVAHYKTVDTRHTAKAGAGGGATLWYYISRATPGYKVVVTVSSTRGKRHGYCRTSFIPHHD